MDALSGSIQSPLLVGNEKEEKESKDSTCWKVLCFFGRWWGLTALAILVTTWLVLSFTVFSSNTWKVLKLGSIPLVSIAFTYLHIWLALHMTFYPLEFIGCLDPFFGWQGIVPRKAREMSEKAVDLMTTQLIDVQEVFRRIQPVRVAQVLGPTLQENLRKVIDDVAMSQAPDFWIELPRDVKNEIITKAAEDAPPVIAALMDEIRNNITRVFDVKTMVVTALVKDKALLNELFIRAGHKELKYIRVLGAKIGFWFGLVQMIVFLFYRAWWILPLSGFIGGYSTNWLALKMIFKPVEPRSVCGMTWQGLFLKRQTEVSNDYASLVSKNILNSQNILNAILHGASSDRLFQIIGKHVRRGVDKYAGISKPIIEWSIGSETYERAKRLICERVLSDVPQNMSLLEGYADEALDMETLLRTRLNSLSSLQFERLLHPVFEEDEWKLIVLGGILGIIVGLGQQFLLF